MLKRTFIVLTALAVSVPAAALACGNEKKTTVTTLTLEEAKQAKASFVDVNGKETRSKYGIIPGAILLTSSDEFLADKELPKDKEGKLVFYCASTQCGASKRAAMKAMDSGYTNVAVLPDGIKGWKAAGLPIEKSPQT